MKSTLLALAVVATLLLPGVHDAQAASVRIGASVTFIRVENIKVEDQNFTIASATPGTTSYQVQQSGKEKIIVIE